jgi:hypothetical protein
VVNGNVKRVKHCVNAAAVTAGRINS